jgi:enoyl-CoA hydratase/carnithine racemase
LYEKQRHGVLITLNRPNALNAMNQDLLGELDHALAEAETDPEIRAVVLTGAGGTFSVGEDISGDDPATAWPYGIPEGSSLVHEYDRLRDADRRGILGRQLYRWEYPKPIIGAVRAGASVPHGWLLLPCNYRGG